jgi:hypothetical protein
MLAACWHRRQSKSFRDATLVDVLLCLRETRLLQPLRDGCDGVRRQLSQVEVCLAVEFSPASCRTIKISGTAYAYDCNFISVLTAQICKGGQDLTATKAHHRRAAVGLPSRSKRHASLRRSGAERGGLHCGLRLRRVPVPRRGGRVPASESASSSPSAGGIRMKLAHAIFPQRAQAWLHRGDRRRPHQQQLSTNALTGVVAVYAGSGPEPRRSP